MTHAEYDAYIDVHTDVDHITNIHRTLGITCFHWLADNCAGGVKIHCGALTTDRILYFENEVDAMLFKLKWT
jgi:hypothetical protein